MTDQVFVDVATGETRVVRVRGDRATGLVIARWSDCDRPKLGEAFVGRVRSVEAGHGLAFVDLGAAPDGVLRWTGSQPPKGLAEGVLVRVEIAAEAYAEKGPRLRRLPGSPGAETPLGRQGEAADPASLFDGDVIDDAAAARVFADAAVEQASADRVALPGGGGVVIEPTRALTAIDVDGGGAVGALAASAARVNAAAADEIARHCALRSLGGLLAVDFISLKDAARARAAEKALSDAFESYGVKAEIAPASRFGVVECALERGRRPVAETLLDAQGRASAETLALAALRRLEAEAAADRACRFILAVAPDVAAWLTDDRIGWRAVLTERLGSRFDVAVADIDRETWDLRRA